MSRYKSRPVRRWNAVVWLEERGLKEGRDVLLNQKEDCLEKNP